MFLMRYILAIITICFTLPLNAQWVSFNLKSINPDKFQQQVEPYLKSLSLSTARHFLGSSEKK